MERPERLDWNIFREMQGLAGQQPDHAMIRVDQDEQSYGQFVDAVEAIAASLVAHGVRPGQRIAIILPNSVSWYQLFWAAVAIGALPVPLDPQVGAWELDQLFGILGVSWCFAATRYRANPVLANLLALRSDGGSGPRIVLGPGEGAHAGAVSWDEFLQGPGSTALAVKQTAWNDLLMLACTSGTTGNPKIIAVEQGGFRQSQWDMAEYLGLGPADVMLLGMPLYHQGGFGMGLQAILKGGTVIYQPKFEPVAFLQTIATRRVTVIQLTATIAKVLLTVPDFGRYRLDSVKTAYFAGETLPDELARVFTDQLGIRVVNIIGSSETGTMVVWDSVRDADVPVNDFRPLDFTRVRVVDASGAAVSPGGTGEIRVQTDAVLREYWENPVESRAKISTDGGGRWFSTGDLGTALPDGRVRFVGRLKRVIKRGANLVYPEEVESFLLTHPQVAAVAVQKQAHELFGEMITATVQAAAGSGLDEKELIKFCRKGLSSYKIPDQFRLVEEIPKDIGKIQYKYLATTQGERGENA
jgi:fatty-acyl-CoA synthase